MEILEDVVPCCALKCLRNIYDVSDGVHPLKYGVNTIGRGKDNDIVLKNLNVSRTHCHLRVEKKDTKVVAFIKDLDTSNGTMVGNINLLASEEHQLNYLDMIVLASGDDGVVLQFIDKIDRFSTKRKVEENLDESTAVKMPKLGPDEQKKSFSNEKTNLSDKSKDSNNIVKNLQNIDLNQSVLSDINLKSKKDPNFQLLPVEELRIASEIVEPSFSHINGSTQAFASIKTDPDNINNIFSQGSYSKQEDSVIVICSSDEEEKNDVQIPDANIELQKHVTLSTTLTNNIYPSTSKIGNNSHVSELPVDGQIDPIVISDDDDVAFVPPELNSNKNIINHALISSSDSKSDSSSKCLKIIEPLPIPLKKTRQVLAENISIMKTRAKSEKIKNNKKKEEEIIVDQNKKIIQDRRLKLQQLAKNSTFSSTMEKTLYENSSSNVNEFLTTDQSKKKVRISRLKQIHCMPSTSKSHLDTDVSSAAFNNQKSVQNYQDETTKMNDRISQHMGSSIQNINPFHFAYFDTLSKICKWNVVWLHEEKLCDKAPPLLVEPINKMKNQFENTSEYTSAVRPLLLYEIWSKISESYNTKLYENPSLEQLFSEKSLNKNIPLHTFDVISVNREFSTSCKALKSIREPLWCLKCTETDNNKTQPTFSLKGHLCIVIIHSDNFELSVMKMKKPKKSRNIFFAYVHTAKKNGPHSNERLFLELIVTKKTVHIPNGTVMHLMDIFYLHSELRLFQALHFVTTSSLCNAIITPQNHDFTIDYSKTNLKKISMNNSILNSSQKEAVKMAIAICTSNKPNIGLIVGPPGTGKTNVISNIVLTLLSKPQTKAHTKPKLLLCAPSNEAVDALVKRIIEINNDIKHELQINVVRVGGGQKYDSRSPIVDVMLDNLVKQRLMNPLSSANVSIYSNKKDIEKDILLKADVVVTTLNSCFSYVMEEVFMRYNFKTPQSCHFTACIVDEAGQCTEPLNYVPILLGINKLILVGDDKQLQPVVKSKSAKDNGLTISLFKRLKIWFEREQQSQEILFPITMLDTQYRMHTEICHFPSTQFYNGVIKTASSVKARKPLPFQPYIILEHESQQDNSGEVNIGEANMIVSLVEILLNSECKSLSIAILTPYHKQREQINKLLERKNILLNVNTIDSFQGSECEILLISTVRTNGIGFMDDTCRLNVALTRAKQSLIICGNFMSLKGDPIWCNLLDDAKERKLFKRISNRVMNNSRTLLAMIKY